jgi:hypothetical protein
MGAPPNQMTARSPAWIAALGLDVMTQAAIEASVPYLPRLR